MTDNMQPADENSTPQQPSQVNWNQNQFGFNPFFILEKIFPGFRKTLAHGFGWDYNNTIWRPQGVDSAGNLRIANGTQGANPPLQTSVAVTTVPINALLFNPTRSGFIIYNDGLDNTSLTVPLILTYPNIDNNAQIFIPPGYAYQDNSWNGVVSLSIAFASLTTFATIVQF